MHPVRKRRFQPLLATDGSLGLEQALTLYLRETRKLHRERALRAFPPVTQRKAADRRTLRVREEEMMHNPANQPAPRVGLHQGDIRILAAANLVQFLGAWLSSAAMRSLGLLIAAELGFVVRYATVFAISENPPMPREDKMTRDTVPEHPRNIGPHSLGFEEAVAYVTTTNPTFLLKEIEIRGERYPIFANAPQTVPEMLLGARAAYGGGSKTHLVYRDERLSFNSFLGQVAAAGTALRDQLGVRAGDRVAIVTRNYPEMVIALHAISVVGAVPVLMNGWWTSQELEFGMTDCNARVAIADGPRLERLMPLRDRLDLKLVGIRDAEEQGAHDWSALLATHIDAPMPEAQIAPDDEFAIMYSSGSTGAPKGVIQTHRGVVNAVWSWMMQPHLAADGRTR